MLAPVAVCLVGLALSSAAACAETNIQILSVQITEPDGTQQPPYAVREDDLTSNLSTCPMPYSDQQWQQPDAPAEQLDEYTWSLDEALTCVPGSPLASGPAIQSIVVLQSNGKPEAELLPPDLTTPSDFANPDQVPVVETGGAYNTYFRPSRGAGDDFAADEVNDTAPIQVQVYEGEPLQVTLAAPSSGQAGTALAFTASVTNQDGSQPAAGSLQYDWTFGDGDGSAVADPTHTYAQPGSYEIDLEVTDGGSAGVASADITIASATPQTTTTQTTATATTGPTNSSGTKPGAGAGKPTTSTGTGKAGTTKGAGNHPVTVRSTPTPTPTPTHNAKQTQKPNPKPKPTVTVSTHKTNAGSSSSTGAVAQTHTSTTPAAASAGTGSPSTTPKSTQPSKPAHPSTAKPRAPTDTTPPNRHRGKAVSGLLIGTVTPASPATISKLEAAATGARATAPSSRSPQSASELGAIAAVTGVVLLLTLGAWRELGRRTRPV